MTPLCTRPLLWLIDCDSCRVKAAVDRRPLTSLTGNSLPQQRSGRRVDDILCGPSLPLSTHRPYTGASHTPPWLRAGCHDVGLSWRGVENHPAPSDASVAESHDFLLDTEARLRTYEFGSIFAAARTGDKDQFTVAVRTLANDQAFRDRYPMRAQTANALVATGLPRLLVGVASLLKSAPTSSETSSSVSVKGFHDAEA